MNKKHIHAELIHAWADGATIQAKQLGYDDTWADIENPNWCETTEYRIKPEPLVLYINEYERTGISYSKIHKTEEIALSYKNQEGYIRTIKLQEVTE